MIRLLTLIFLLSLCQQSFAGGKETGGGYLVQVGPNQYDLADMYFKPKGNKYTYSDEMTAQLQRLQHILSNWGLQVSDFFNNEIFNLRVEYRLVENLPQDCIREIDDFSDGELNFHQFACTQGYITYIVPLHFQNLDLFRTVAAIIHERLHANELYSHATIMPFVRAIVLLQQINANRENYPHLTEQVRLQLQQIFYSAGQLRFASDLVMSTKIHPNGGGAVLDSTISLSTYLSIDSYVRDTSIASESFIENSQIYRCSIGSQVVLSNGNCRNSTLSNSIRINQFSLQDSILSSGIQTQNLKLKNITVNYPESIGPNVDLSAQHRNSFSVGRNIYLEDVTLHGQFRLIGYTTLKSFHLISTLFYELDENPRNIAIFIGKEGNKSNATTLENVHFNNLIDGESKLEVSIENSKLKNVLFEYNAAYTNAPSGIKIQNHANLENTEFLFSRFSWCDQCTAKNSFIKSPSFITLERSYILNSVLCTGHELINREVIERLPSGLRGPSYWDFAGFTRIKNDARSIWVTNSTIENSNVFMTHIESIGYQLKVGDLLGIRNVYLSNSSISARKIQSGKFFFADAPVLMRTYYTGGLSGGTEGMELTNLKLQSNDTITFDFEGDNINGCEFESRQSFDAHDECD